MWYLHGFNDTYIYFTKDKYTVGRKNKDIIIENDDSISRNHGLFEIKENDLYISDVGSKYGTYLGTERLEPNRDYKLSVNNIVTFGLLSNNQSKFKVKKLDNIFVVFSNIKESIDRKNQYAVLEKLKIKYNKSTWERSCTHLIVKELKLTCKVLCAITLGQHIVNMNFFPDLLKAIDYKTKIPKEKDYRPDFRENLLNKNINLDYNPERKTLFKDLIFVFLNEAIKTSIDDAVHITGGKTISWEKNKVSMDTLKENINQYIFIENTLKVQNTSETPSETSNSFHEAIKFITSSGRRCIPQQEIALAIIYNSKTENCNPLFSRAGLLCREGTQNTQSESIIVYDTEHSSNQTQNSNPDVPSVVQPSFETQNTMEDTPGAKRKIEDPIQENNSKKHKGNEKILEKSLISCKSKTNVQKNPILEDLVENPFTRKRKASNKLEQEPKKKPLANISNQADSRESNINKTSKKISFLQSTSWIEKIATFVEIKHEEAEIDILQELFKDSVIIEPCEVASRPVTLPQNNSSVKNFKKFKKIHQNIQHDIISNLSKIVIGDESLVISDEENDDLEYVSISSSNTSTTRQPRRKFQFVL